AARQRLAWLGLRAMERPRQRRVPAVPRRARRDGRRDRRDRRGRTLHAVPATARPVRRAARGGGIDPTGVNPPVPVAGAVLTGGASRRMGTDKALLEVDGRPLARRLAEVLAAAGCDPVWCQGGDEPALRALGLDVVP